VVILFIVIVVVVVLFVVAWGSLRSGGSDDPELDPRTSRRQMDQQFKKPPNEGGLL
jgi:hypothetical protein